ncbi:MAG: ion channel [Gammaproteobacteria bacterium]|nr:ion channel [Gammaproteobacteria bacterium]
MQKDNFRYLLVALILYLIIVPVLKGWLLVPRSWLTSISFVFLLSIGVWSLRHSIRVFRIAMILAVSGIALNLAAASVQNVVLEYLSTLTIFMFLLLATWSSFRQVAFATEMSSNRIYGAICVYLLLGVLWSLMYAALHVANPDAFSGAVLESTRDPSGQWVYFSFVTLTTLGYGDILPVSAGARALAYAEAIFGVFYMATLVAMLVSAYANDKQR